jgi:beta-lactamase regulating signal transducer with metallopeptidase domain
MRALAFTLLHFLWQGAAIAALAAALMSLFRESSTRYLIGIGALALMFASFGVTFALLSAPPAGGDGLAVDSTPISADVAPAAVTRFVAQASPALSIASGYDFTWVARTWLVGVCLLALRIAFGLLLLEQLRRRNLLDLPVGMVERFRALQRRLGISRLVRYCECRMVNVPSVIGFFHPVVLLPMRALTGLSAEQLEAVIAHELGHVKRFDVAVNFLQVIAETLFFFHPAVWWLNKHIRADREDCCDDVAIAACGRKVIYARALATMADWRDTPELAMAATGGGVVASRVARLLGIQQKNGARSAGVITASLVLATALMAGAASVGVAQEPTRLAQADVPAPPTAPAPVSAPVATPAPAAAPAPSASVPVYPRVAANPKPVAAAKPASTAANGDTDAKPRGGSYIDQMKSAGFDNLDVDQLIAFKVQGVTPEYVAQIRALGFKPDADDIVGMKAQGITPEYVAQIRALGFKPDADEIVGMKAQGITPEYVAQIRALGFKPDADDIIGMKAQGITPEFVKSMREMGIDPDADEIIALKAQGITPEYRRAMEAAGYKLDADDLIAAKVMDVTPEFIQSVQAHGFKNLSMDQLIQLKNADVL